MYTKNILFMYSKNILIADDLPATLNRAEDMLSREQVNLINARCGPEAVKLIREEKPDLVFMALDMVGGNGDDACREIKSDSSLRSTPIIMLISSDDPGDLERCRKAGCDDVIHKPFTREILRNTSRKFIKFPGWSGKRTEIEALVKYGVSPEKHFEGTLSDISVGGIFLEAADAMPIGSELHLEFRLGQDMSPIQCKGRVNRINRNTDLNEHYALPSMGIEFIDIKKLDILSIQSFVSKGS
ncbi:MAG: response regulator [Desulfuromonadales bacterium]